MTPEAQSYQPPTNVSDDKKRPTFVIAVSEGVEHRFTSDNALDCRYLRLKGADAVPHALFLFQGYLRLERKQDCAVR
jgi:hypothetical protein